MIDPNVAELDFIRSCHVADEADFLKKCRIYGDFLYETNQTLNLTRIPAEEFWSKHVCDSLAIAREVKLPDSSHHMKMCDVGCGGGLPSLILASAFPNLFVTAIDSTGKKIRFVEQAAEKMGLTNLRAIQIRANELGHKSEFRHSFPLVTARAVAGADVLIRETAGLISRNGELVIYRTPTQAEPEAEWLRGLKKAIDFELTDTLELPGGGTRLFLKIRGLG